MAYLDFVNSGGNTYVYVSEYVGQQKNSTKRERRIARLGRLEQAYMELRIWQIDSKKIPNEINNEDRLRIPEWINMVRNRGA